MLREATWVRTHSTALAPALPVTSGLLPAWLQSTFPTCQLPAFCIHLFSNWPLHTPTQRLLPIGSSGQEGQQANETGWNPFLLPSKPYTTGIQASWLIA
jgi:hypothetical protein